MLTAKPFPAITCEYVFTMIERGMKFDLTQNPAQIVCEAFIKRAWEAWTYAEAQHLRGEPVDQKWMDRISDDPEKAQRIFGQAVALIERGDEVRPEQIATIWKRVYGVVF